MAYLEEGVQACYTYPKPLWLTTLRSAEGNIRISLLSDPWALSVQAIWTEKGKSALK